MAVRKYSIISDPDIFDEDQSDISFLSSKPTCFAVFGPPSAGKSTVARLLSQYWKCLLLNPKNIVAEALKRPNTAAALKKVLYGKDGVPEEIVLHLVLQKIITKEAFHYGYVLDDFPSSEVSGMSLEEQFKFLQNLELKVDFVIMIRFPLEDAVRRREAMYYHISSGILVPASYISETREYQDVPESKALELDEDEELLVAAPAPKKEKVAEDSEEVSSDNEEENNTSEDKPGSKRKKTHKEDLHNEDTDDQGSQEGEAGVEDEEEEQKASVNSSVVFKNTTFNHTKRKRRKIGAKETLTQGTDREAELNFFHQLFFPDLPLVRGRIQFPRESLCLRVEDSPEWIQDNYLDFKKIFLPHIENFIAGYYPLRVIEIDGNMPLSAIPKLLLSRLECMRVQKPAVPRPMQDLSALQKMLEDPPDQLEEQLEQSLSISTFSPRWKWRRSVWGTFCPVNMFEGQMLNGLAQFATVFLDRIYFLANKLAQDKFLENPRLYILPPNPRAPIRCIIFGPPRSGRTQLAIALSTLFSIRVIDVSKVLLQVNYEQKTAFLVAARAAAAKQALKSFQSNAKNALWEAKQNMISLANEYQAFKPRSITLDDIEVLLNDDTAAFSTEVAFIESPDTPNTPLPDPNEPTTPNPIPIESLKRNLTPEQQQRLANLESKLEIAKAVFIKAQQDMLLIDINHVGVVNEIERIMSEVNTEFIEFDSQRYLTLVKELLMSTAEGIDSAAPERHLWILDNVLLNPNVIRLLLELPPLLRPTDCVFMKDKSKRLDGLKSFFVQAQKTIEPGFVLADEVWDQKLSTLSQQLLDLSKVQNQLSKTEVRVHSMDIISKSSANMAKEIQDTLKALFKSPVTEYEDIEAEEEEKLEEEEDDEERPITMFKSAEENSDKTKPVGEAGKFCPVALKEMKTLWPGDPQHGGVMYKDKIYYFSTTEAKEKFSKDPDVFLPVLQPLPIPPLKIFVIGPTGSGRTTHAKLIAQSTNAIVINLRNYMVELATPKLQKPPIELFKLDKKLPYWRLPKKPLPNAADLPILDKELPMGLLPVRLPFISPDPTNPIPPNAVEQACIDSLSGDIALTSEVLETFFDQWMRMQPFAGRNLVFDGFPRYPDDARFLMERGLLPDAVILLTMDSNNTIQRVLPDRKNHWLQEKRKRDEKRRNSHFNKHRDWVKHRATRKAELLIERAQAKKQKQQELERRRAKEKGEEIEDEDDEEDDEAVEQILTDELPEPTLEDEKEEESETEDEAENRLSDDLRNQIERDVGNIDAIKEIFEEHQIEIIETSTKRPFPLASKNIRTKLDVILKRREHVFEKAYPVTAAMAKEMLDVHYKRWGKFGTWCPVKIRQGHFFPPSAKTIEEQYPVIYRQYIYFCSSSQARTEFISKPEFYVRLLPPRLCLPFRIAVIGPPKSGKTTFANRLAHEIGISRISIGDALRYVASTLALSELGRMLKVYFTSGSEIPDNLEVLCLEAFLRTADCQARGWIIDGYPTTISKLNLMLQRFIVPTVVFELCATNKICVYRSIVEHMTTKKLPLPLFNNAQVVANRLAHYKKNSPHIRSYLEYAMKNYIEIDASMSKWKMWYTAMQIIAERMALIQDYIERREARRAAPLTYLCVTPNQMMSRLSEEYYQYCPITLNTEEFYFDCIERGTFQLIAEYRDKYYLFATKEKLDMFLKDPDRWLPPQAQRIVPPREKLAQIVKLEELEDQWGDRIGFFGLCPVTYFNYQCTSPGLKYGSSKWLVEYLGKIYKFMNEDCLHSFIGSPERYANLPEPAKRPPQAEHPPQPIHHLSPVPFLESEIGPYLLQALIELLEFRPKYPLLGYKQSALTFLGTYLKCINSKAEKITRDINVKKLEEFTDVIKLAERLVLNTQDMGKGYDIIRKETPNLLKVREKCQKDWLKLNHF